MVTSKERFHCDYCPAEFKDEEVHEEIPWQPLEIEITYEQLGKRLKQARQEAGLTQKEVGKHLECSHVAICHREQGKTETGAIELVKLAVLYQKPLSFFFE